MVKNFLKKLNEKPDSVDLSPEMLAEMLKTNKEAYQKFEKAYTQALEQAPELSYPNAKEITKRFKKEVALDDSLINQIVNELLAQSVVYVYNGKGQEYILSFEGRSLEEKVSMEQLKALPKEQCPQLSGSHMAVECPSKGEMDVFMEKFQNEKDSKKKQQFYHHIRQGVDILDLNGCIYSFLSHNPNSIGTWMPALVSAADKQDFFKIPKTKILRVPMQVLQMSRLPYECLTEVTKEILNRYCVHVFELDLSSEYFIKTGVFSSKYDFRNAHIQGEKEVREIGEYLTFISNLASSMAHYDFRTGVCRYGAATTNEWVVREYIQPKEDTPYIYNGLPLRTEYRIFIDLDERNVMGIHEYWDPEVMKKRFDEQRDVADTHDRITYAMMEETLMGEYRKNKDLMIEKVSCMLPDMAEKLSGQWSLDIMQNGEDFYLIDMAVAKESAYFDCI